MKFLSPVFSQVSGSVGGGTFAHTRGGMYLRARGKPPNSNTPRQLDVRASLSQLVTQWATVCTDAQRTAWTGWADATPRTNLIGNSFKMSGQQAFVASNTPRVQAGLPEVYTGPTTAGLAELGAVSVTAADATPGTLAVTFDATQDWATEDDGALLVYASVPQLPTINFFKGPYYLAGIVPGDAMTPPTSPATITLANATVVGQRVYWRIYATNADGRFSTDALGFSTVV